MSLLPPAGNLGLGSWPARRARIDGAAVALSQGGRRLTWSDLTSRTARLAGALRAHGVAHGDRVAYLGPNDLSVFETCFAAGQLGAVLVPLNTRLAVPELLFMLADSGARVLVLDDAAGDTAAGLRAAIDPAIHPALTVLRRDELDDLVAAHEPLPEPAEVVLEDPALLLYTSGTTGRPKAAVLTHGALTWNTVNQLAHLDLLSTDRALCLAPLFHAVGFGQVTLPVLFKGGQVEVVAKFDAGTVLHQVESLRVTCFSAVPTMLQLLAEHPDWESADLTSLRLLVYGGSPAVDHVSRAWQRRGVVLQQGYGMTEAAPGVLMAPAHGSSERPTSAGVPHFFTDVASLGDGGPEPVGAEPRELLVRGPHLFDGYWQRPEDTRADVVDGAWWRTGDVLAFDEAGWGHVVDRVKDVIISGGENVYPAEVEAALVALDGVRSAAVVGVPDERWGEVGAAYLEPVPGHELDEAQVLEALRGRLAGFKVPARLHVVPELPRNATGKVQKQLLRHPDTERRTP